MTGQQAIQLLQKPVFGDEACLQAVKVYSLVGRLKQLRRDWSHYDSLEHMYSQSPAPEPHELTEKQLKTEIDYWEGYEEDFQL